MNARHKKLYISITAVLLAGTALLSPLAAFGDDVPLPPSNFRANDGQDRYTFSWSKAGRTGANGGTVNPDNVSYVLEALNESYEPQRVLVSDKVLNYTLFYPTTNGEQDIMRFGLYARNTAGKSAYTYLKVVTGAPYNLPYRESFALGKLRSLGWQEGEGTFAATTDYSSDEDLGALLCIPASDLSASSFNLGKIVLEHAQHPRLTFRLKGVAERDKLAVKIGRPDGQEGTLLTVSGPIDEWTLYSIDLSTIGRQKYIIPKFQIAQGNEEAFLIDDIAVTDPYEADLSVLVRPSNRSAEHPSVKVMIENAGLTPCSDAAVALYVDGKLASRQSLRGEIAPGMETEMEFPLNVKDTEPKEVKAVVEWAFDLNPYNDVATTLFVMDEPLQNQLNGVEEILRNGAVGPLTVYSIDGRSLTVSDPGELQPGIYVANGKKFIVR